MRGGRRQVVSNQSSCWPVGWSPFTRQHCTNPARCLPSCCPKLTLLHVSPCAACKGLPCHPANTNNSSRAQQQACMVPKPGCTSMQPCPARKGHATAAAHSSRHPLLCLRVFVACHHATSGSLPMRTAAKYTHSSRHPCPACKPPRSPSPAQHSKVRHTRY